MTKKSLHINLTSELADQLQRVAFKANTSVSDVVRQLLEDPHNQAKLKRAAKSKQGIFT